MPKKHKAKALEALREQNAPIGPPGKTIRGFGRIDFLDVNGVACSLQQSSAILGNNYYDRPGASAVWLGCNDADPQVLGPNGWQPVPMPEGYTANMRMHLDRRTN